MSHSETRASHIVIVGSGFTGMVCALDLLKAGYRVTLLEAGLEPGGLTCGQNFGDFTWDRFYHCILTSDAALLSLLDELGLSNKLRWTATEVGFFSHGKLYKLTSPLDLLHFPLLSLLDKLRLGLGTLYISHLSNGKVLEDIPLGPWTQRIFGKKVYTEMWEPLFRCKLGEMRHSASAAFLWGTIRRLYSTRENGPQKQEKLGYVAGGYTTVFKKLYDSITARGGEIMTSTPVTSVASLPSGSGQSGRVRITSGNKQSDCDGVIITAPNRAILGFLQTDDVTYTENLSRVQYLGLICVVLILRKPLSEFYVTNITEESPFTGVIEMTNLISTVDETAGHHLVYLPRYTQFDDPLFSADEDSVWATFEPALKRMHPTLEDADISRRFVFRERSVQPVPTLGYSRIAPPAATPLPGVYVANTAQIINNTLNNNAMTEIAHAASRRLMQDIPLTLPTAASSSQADSVLVPRSEQQIAFAGGGRS
jgi:protoporphyrinogen oxidase